MTKHLLFSIKVLSKKAYYPWLLCLMLCLIGWLLVYPQTFEVAYKAYHQDSSGPFYRLIVFYNQAWEVVVLKSNDLTNKLTHTDPESWIAKKVFRISIPLLMRVAHIPPIGIIAIQAIAGFLILLFSYKLTYQIIHDSLSSTFFTACIAFTYVGRSAYIDTYAWFDAFSYLFLILSVYFTKSFLIFLSSSFAAWNDERAFLALIIVFFFHQMQTGSKEKKHELNLVKLNVNSLSVAVAMIAYMIIRFYLEHRFEMKTPTVNIGFSRLGISVLKFNVQYLGIGIWTFLEGLWFIYILALFYLCLEKKWKELAFLLLSVVGFTFLSYKVYDVTRSGAYIIPISFTCIHILRQMISITRLREILFFSSLSCLIYPAYYIMGGQWIIMPTIIRFIKALMSY